MSDRPSEIEWEVMVDWDATDWKAVPSFDTGTIDDISDDVNFNGWQRGKDTEEGNSPAGTHEIKLKAGLCAKYSYYTTGVLVGKIRPWLPIRIRAIHDGNTYPVFQGFISSIKVDPRPDKQMVYIYVTDGIDLLARQTVSQDYSDRAQMTDGAAVGKILDAGGWGTLRSIDINGGDITNYPKTQDY